MVLKNRTPPFISLNEPMVFYWENSTTPSRIHISFVETARYHISLTALDVLIRVCNGQTIFFEKVVIKSSAECYTARRLAF